jgi:hypothetical protein
LADLADVAATLFTGTFLVRSSQVREMTRSAGLSAMSSVMP